MFEGYLHYKEQPTTSGLVSSTVKAIEGKTGRAESTIGSTRQGSPPKGSSNVSGATEDLFAQPSSAQKAQKEIHYPKTMDAFKGIKDVETKRLVIARALKDEILDSPVYTDVDYKDKSGKVLYTEDLAEKSFNIMKFFQSKNPDDLTITQANDYYKVLLPAIIDAQERNTLGYGLPHPLTKQTMGGSLHHTKSAPMGEWGSGLKKTVMMGAFHTPSSIPIPKKKGNIIFGKGLSSVVMPQPKLRVESKNIDLSKGITAEPAYVPFGTHLLNKHKLKDNIVMMRTKKGGAIVNIPTQRVNGKLAKVLHTICGGGIPQFESVMDLADDDKALLHRITKTSKVSDRLSVPNPNKSKMEEEDNRFNILRGEVSIGNDAPSVIKEFKVLLLKFMREGRVPMGQGKAIMEELLLLGY